MADPAGDGGKDPRLGDPETQRHIKRLALARLFRLMTGLQKKPCPSVAGACYWCERPVFWEGRYIGGLRGTHGPGCPWNEVLDYQYLEDEWLVREANLPTEE